MSIDRTNLKKHLWFGLTAIGVLAAWYFSSKKIHLEINPHKHREYTYQIQYDSNTEAPSDFTNLSSAISQSQSIQIQLSAELKFAVIEHSDKTTELMLSLSPNANDSSSTAMQLIHEKQLAKIFVKNNGEVEKIAIPRSSLDGASLLMTEILRHFFPQLPTHSVKVGDRWLTSHEDSELELNQLTDKFASLKKLSKRGSSEDQAESADYSIDLSENFVKKVSIDLHRRTNEASKIIQSSLKLTIDLVDSTDTDGSSLKVLIDTLEKKEPITETLDNKTLLQMQNVASLKKILGLDTAASLKDQILKADPKDRHSNMKLYSKLKALLILFPESASEFSSCLIDFDRLDDRFSMVATAMTAVGSLEAQKVIRNAIETVDSDFKKKQRLIPNLSFTQTPSRDSEDFVRKMAKDDASESIRGTAHRALGTIAHALRQSNPERSQAIHREYAEVLNKAGSKKERLDALDVLGNIGLADQTKTTEPYLNSQDEETRERAYNSLRFVPSEEAVDLLMNGLRKETGKKIREVIAEALSYQNFQDERRIDQVRDLIYTEKNITVVKHLLRNLAQHYDKFSKAVTIIDQYAKDCGHPDLCGYVSSISESIKSKR